MPVGEANLSMDGPRLVEWLEDRDCLLTDSFVGASSARAIRRWREGATPSLWDVDALLTKLDIHLDELPEDLRPSDEPAPPARDRGGVPKGYGAKLSDAQVRVLYRLHAERKFTVATLAGELWEQAGFASAESASWSIRQGFRRLGLPLIYHHAQAAGARRCTDRTLAGRPCGQRPLADSDRCWDHDPRTRSKARDNALRNSPWAEAA